MHPSSSKAWSSAYRTDQPLAGIQCQTNGPLTFLVFIVVGAFIYTSLVELLLCWKAVAAVNTLRLHEVYLSYIAKKIPLEVQIVISLPNILVQLLVLRYITYGLLPPVRCTGQASWEAPNRATAVYSAISFTASPSD